MIVSVTVQWPRKQSDIVLDAVQIHLTVAGRNAISVNWATGMQVFRPSLHAMSEFNSLSLW